MLERTAGVRLYTDAINPIEFWYSIVSEDTLGPDRGSLPVNDRSALIYQAYIVPSTWKSLAGRILPLQPRQVRRVRTLDPKLRMLIASHLETWHPTSRMTRPLVHFRTTQNAHLV